MTADVYLYTVRGRRTMLIDGAEVPVEPGVLVSYPPGGLAWFPASEWTVNRDDSTEKWLVLDRPETPEQAGVRWTFDTHRCEVVQIRDDEGTFYAELGWSGPT